MTATPALTTDLQRQVLILEDDLRKRVAADSEREADWKREHQRAVVKERTASSWVAWRDDRVTQAAVAWVLTTVFVRFCEDNALVKPVWISGPEGRRQEALDAQLAFFRAHPEDTDREWLMRAVDYLAALPATKALVDQHSALRLVSPSGDAVTALLDFWRRRQDNGALVHDLADKSLSTRFLGDLYQDLSQYAKETYALLQTPVFVEEFILDRTLEPALKERPLEGFKLIDPDLRVRALPAGRLRPTAGALAQARAEPRDPGPRPDRARRDPRCRPQPVRRRDRPVPADGRRAQRVRRNVAGRSPGVHVPPGRRRFTHPRPGPRCSSRHGRPQRLHVLHLRHRRRPAPPDLAGRGPLRRSRRKPARTSP